MTSISLRELESVKELHEEALSKSHRIDRYQALTSRKKYLTSLHNSIEGLELLKKASLGIKERELYVRTGIDRVNSILDYFGEEDPFSLVSKPVCLAFLQFSRKLIYDLYDGFDSLLKIKQNNESQEVIQNLIQKKEKMIKTYIITHEQDKMKNLEKFRELRPYITTPIVRAGGVYGRGIKSRCYLTGAFGEYLQPKLYVVNKEQEVVQAMRKIISELPLNERAKEIIIREIKPRVVDEIFSGHPVNSDIFYGFIQEVAEIAGTYLFYHSGGCMPFFEWEGLYTVIFPTVEVGRATLYSPRAINHKLHYINTVSECLNLERVPYVND